MPPQIVNRNPPRELTAAEPFQELAGSLNVLLAVLSGRDGKNAENRIPSSERKPKTEIRKAVAWVGRPSCMKLFPARAGYELRCPWSAEVGRKISANSAFGIRISLKKLILEVLKAKACAKIENSPKLVDSTGVSSIISPHQGVHAFGLRISVIGFGEASDPQK